MTAERREILEEATTLVSRTFVCAECKKTVEVLATALQWKQYDEQKYELHDIFPELNGEMFGVLTSGVCDACFDLMFDKEQTTPFVVTADGGEVA